MEPFPHATTPDPAVLSEYGQALADVDLLPAVYEAYRDLYFVLDAHDRILDFRDGTAHDLYVEPGTFIGRRFEEVLPGQAGEIIRNGIAQARSAGRMQTVEYSLPLPRGEQVFEGRIVPIRRGGLLFIARNITVQRATEEAVRRAEANYRGIFENAVEGIFQSVPEGRYLSVNPTLATTYGYSSPEELIGTLIDIENQLYVDRERRRQFVRMLREHDTVTQFESRVYRKDGEIIWISESARAVRDDEGRLLYYEGIVEDITARKRSEELLRETNRRLEVTLDELRATQQQVIQQERLRVLGQVASGVAHDFNNLLSVITGYTDLLSLKLAAGGAEEGYVREIRAAADRATSLTRQILTAFRRQAPSPQTLDLPTVVTGMSPMLRRLIRADIELVWLCDPNTGSMKGDRAQLEQVLMNLVVNARDAIEHSGRITLLTSAAHVNADQAAFHGVAAGEYALISVSDTGCGIDPEALGHIFEPFFTTKPPGKGVGLGLALVSGVAQQAGGFVEVDSTLGTGTRFRLYFPQVEAATVAPPAPAPEAPVGGTERILLAEDEPRLRDLLAQALRAHGYEVVEAMNGVDALHQAERCAGPIDLLLSDVVMPAMGGRELAEKLLAVRHTKVLFMSGYTDDAELRSGAFHPDASFLAKPFPIAALLRKIREILGVAAR